MAIVEIIATIKYRKKEESFLKSKSAPPYGRAGLCRMTNFQKERAGLLR